MDVSNLHEIFLLMIKNRIMVLDLRTRRQKVRDMEHVRIVNMFLSYRNDEAYKKYADSRIFEVIAQDSTVSISTVAGIRNVLIKHGVYQNKR